MKKEAKKGKITDNTLNKEKEPIIASTTFKKKQKIADQDDFDDEIEDDEFDNKPKSKSNNQSLKSVNEDVNIDISDNKRNNVFNISDSATGQGNQLQSQIDNISESSNIPSSVNSGVPD